MQDGKKVSTQEEERAGFGSKGEIGKDDEMTHSFKWAKEFGKVAGPAQKRDFDSMDCM
jgi:hypothetical protein